MNKIFYYLIVGVVLVFAGWGFWIMNEQTPEAQVPAEAETAAQAVKEDLADKQDVEEDDVTIISATVKEWPNSCLGVTKPDLVCLQVITPGYEIVAEVEGENYTYHTNASGTSIVLID